MADALPHSEGTSNRDKAIHAFLALLAERRFEDIGLAEVAGRAGLKLSQLRADFGATLAIYAAHVKQIDEAVLDGAETETGEEPHRDRLFDVMMRRIEALTPHKEAVRSILSSARRNPGLAFALNGIALRSQKWMLEAAGISASGPRGMLRAQGAALLFARVVGVWLDEDEGVERTMAALDRGLASAERWDGFLGDLCAIPCALRRRRGHRRRPLDEGPAEASAA